MPTSTARLLAGLGFLLVASASTASTGCAEPPLEEPSGSTTSELSFCELLAGGAAAATAVAVSSATATGSCAATAAAATVMTGGIAAPGSVVCLAPAASAAVSTVAAALAGGVAYLVCGHLESRVASAASDDGATAGTAAPPQVDYAQCEGRNSMNRSRQSAAECPASGTSNRLDVVYCHESFSGGSSNYVGPDGKRWMCTGGSPHYPCLPSIANGGDASHRHYYDTRYNFSPNRACCYYAEVETRVTCGVHNVP